MCFILIKETETQKTSLQVPPVNTVKHSARVVLVSIELHTERLSVCWRKLLVQCMLSTHHSPRSPVEQIPPQHELEAGIMAKEWRYCGQRLLSVAGKFMTNGQGSPSCYKVPLTKADCTKALQGIYSELCGARWPVA